MNKYIAELYGTFLLVLAIVGTFIMTQSLGAPSYVTLLTVALAVSLVLLSNITIFSKVSGAHFNPAVSLMMYLRKNISFQEFISYSLLQILGAVSAVVFAHLTFDFGQTSISFVSRSTNGILLSEFLDQSKRKEKEIAYYERELKAIEEKLYWLRREKDLTETIIKIISEEKVLDIREEMEKKMIQDNGGQNDET